MSWLFLPAGLAVYQPVTPLQMMWSCNCIIPMSASSTAHLAVRAAVVRPLAARAHEAGRAAAHAAGALLGLGLVLGPLLARPRPAAAGLGEVVAGLVVPPVLAEEQLLVQPLELGRVPAPPPVQPRPQPRPLASARPPHAAVRGQRQPRPAPHTGGGGLLVGLGKCE